MSNYKKRINNGHDNLEHVPQQDFGVKSVGHEIERIALERKKIKRENCVEFLQLFPLFSGIDKNSLYKLTGSICVIFFDKGETIIREGQELHHFYLILYGKVKALKNSLSGKELILHLRYSHQPLGVLAALSGFPALASILAMEDTSILAIKKEDFINFMTFHPIVMKRIINQGAETINSLYNKLIDFTDNNVTNRLIKTIYRLACESGEILSYTHKDIADMSGATEETVTRILTNLKHNNIINIERGKLIIKNHQALFAMHNNIASFRHPAICVQSWPADYLDRLAGRLGEANKDKA